MAGTITAQDYASARPFPCTVLDDLGFIDDELLRRAVAETKRLVTQLPGRDGRVRYDNPIEKKDVFGSEALRSAAVPALEKIIERLSSEPWLRFLSEMTEIDNLRADETLHGAGLSVVHDGGFLGLHRDLEVHPVTKLERRVNLALFLNQDWRDEWGGCLELWKDRRGQPVEFARRIRPKRGRIVLFDPQGFHGFPDPISCGHDERRLSLQLFYYSQPRPGKTREKAWFALRPGEDCDAKLNEFRLLMRR